jgi:hypothetical protein
MHKVIVALTVVAFLTGCSFTHTTNKVNYTTFALSRHKKIRDKKKDMVATITIPGDVAKAQSVVRQAAGQLNLKEQEPRKREQYFLFFSNQETKSTLNLGKSHLGIGTKDSADNNIGAFFYPVEEYNVTTIVFTEEKDSSLVKSLRDQMVLIVEKIAPI